MRPNAPPPQRLSCVNDTCQPAGPQSSQPKWMPEHWRANNDAGARLSWLLDSAPFAYPAADGAAPALLCFSEKAGSTMWKQLLLAARGVPGFPSPRLSPHQLRLRNVSTKAHVWAWLQHNESAHRFMWVRHPLDRLLSGWLDPTARRKDPKTRNLTSFGEFVRAIVSSPMVNEHFALQSSKCGVPDGLRYRWLQVEDEAAWFATVASVLGLGKAAASGWREFHGSTDCFVPAACSAPVATALANHASARKEEFYDRELACMANTWAMPDLHLFGYEPWWPDATPASYRSACLRRAGGLRGLVPRRFWSSV